MSRNERDDAPANSRRDATEHRSDRSVPRYRPPSNAAIALADGTVARGRSFGADRDASGEVVFTTTMVGYQEVCTDPSFRGQIVCMTFPLIGNYGVNDDADESRRPWIAGLIVREACIEPSHYLSQGAIGDYLKRWDIPGVEGVDTRALVRRIREIGDSRGIVAIDSGTATDAELIDRARRAPLPGELDVVAEVAGGEDVDGDGVGGNDSGGDCSGPHVVVVDCGLKRNILRSLARRGARVTVVPFGTGFDEIARHNPDGVVVSPGPGDPANLDGMLPDVRRIVESGVPYFGICLGHQLLARAIGATTTKLKFGHRGGNHPVQDVASGRVTITSQNHGYHVDRDTVPRDGGWEIALLNLNDGSVEGLTHRELPVMTVQFHPEASPGPLDNLDLFDRFLAKIADRANQVTVSSEPDHE